jgi:uncharacterized protein
MATVLLLLASNVFMTAAWYGHLRYKGVDLWKVILISWLIALPEYCLQVPANRIGNAAWSPYQLKILQEVITLVVFVGFAMAWFGELPKWNHFVAFGFLMAAVWFGLMNTRLPG